MTSNDLAVPDESRGGQAFGQGISHYFVHAQRHKFEETIQHFVLLRADMRASITLERKQ